MEQFAQFTAVRSLPQACPSCQAAFDSTDAFGLWGVGPADSFVEALTRAHEIFEQEFNVGDLISCAACGSPTFRLIVEERTFLERAEAEALIDSKGFTYVQESEAAATDPEGHLAKTQQFQAQDRARRAGFLFGDQS